MLPLYTVSKLSSKKIQTFEGKSQIDFSAKHFEPCDSSVGVKTAVFLLPPASPTMQEELPVHDIKRLYLTFYSFGIFI